MTYAILQNPKYRLFFGVVLVLVGLITIGITANKFAENKKIQDEPNSSGKTPDDIKNINMSQTGLSVALFIETALFAVGLVLIIMNRTALVTPKLATSTLSELGGKDANKYYY